MKDFDFRDSTQKKQPKKPTVTNKHIEATRKTIREELDVLGKNPNNKRPK